MKKLLIAFFLLQVWLFLIIFSADAQAFRQYNRLSTLGRVWGFLKYYHPAAALGKPDWDSTLVQWIPKVEQAGSDKEFQQLLIDWYRHLPKAALSAKKLNWLADSVDRIFTEENIRSISLPLALREQFITLYQFHQPGPSRYVTRHYEDNYFDHIIHTEDAHESPAYPSAEFRLLALFRYWNTIEYFYPHRNKIKNWSEVLDRYIPVFLQAADSNQYRRAVKQLIHELPDAHSFMQEPGTIYYFTPFRIDYIDGKFLIGQCVPEIARQWDYQAGDEIVKIGELTVKERLSQLSKTVTGTNQSSLYRNYAGELLNTGDSVINVTFNRNGALVTRRVELHSWEVYRTLPKAPAQPLWRPIKDGIWYVRFCAISKPDTLKKLFEDIRLAKSVIWDMRGYPNYPVTTRLGNFLFDQRIQLTEERNASDSFPGSFITSPLYFVPDKYEGSIYRGKMIVLVDEYTQSLSESIAAMLRLRPNTLVMGRPTAGTTGNITWFSLPGDLAVSYTGVGVTGAKNTFKQGRGVRIDKPITIKQADLLRHEDPMLEMAVSFALKNDQ